MSTVIIRASMLEPTNPAPAQTTASAPSAKTTVKKCLFIAVLFSRCVGLLGAPQSVASERQVPPAAPFEFHCKSAPATHLVSSRSQGDRLGWSASAAADAP